jgi:hypothetical protein
MDLTEGSETSAKLNLTPGKYPKENIQDSEHGEILKTRILHLYGEDIATHILHQTFEDGPDSVFRNVGKT